MRQTKRNVSSIHPLTTWVLASGNAMRLSSVLHMSSEQFIVPWYADMEPSPKISSISLSSIVGAGSPSKEFE